MTTTTISKTPTREILVHVTAPSFVAGAVFVGERFKRAAPIVMRHAKRRTMTEFLDYCRGRRWKVKLI